MSSAKNKAPWLKWIGWGVLVLLMTLSPYFWFGIVFLAGGIMFQLVGDAQRATGRAIMRGARAISKAYKGPNPYEENNSEAEPGNNSAGRSEACCE